MRLSEQVAQCVDAVAASPPRCDETAAKVSHLLLNQQAPHGAPAVRRTLEVHDVRLNLDGRHARHLRL
jgi:hypothetical protein